MQKIFFEKIDDKLSIKKMSAHNKDIVNDWKEYKDKSEIIKEKSEWRSIKQRKDIYVFNDKIDNELILKIKNYINENNELIFERKDMNDNNKTQVIIVKIPYKDAGTKYTDNDMENNNKILIQNEKNQNFLVEKKQVIMDIVLK